MTTHQQLTVQLTNQLTHQVPQHKSFRSPPRTRAFLALLCWFIANPLMALEENSKVGRKAAQKYFQARADKEEAESPREVSSDRRPSSSSAQAERYLTLHLGTFLDDQVYKWGNSKNDEDIGKLNAGITYRFGEWTNSMDLLIRADFTSFALDEGRALKMSLLPLILFPDARSEFPLYFGVGAGPGIFFKQISGESSLSLDYQLVAGVRLFNLVDSLGFMLESGLKNHVHLFSDGQFNGVFISGGTVFTF